MPASMQPNEDLEMDGSFNYSLVERSSRQKRTAEDAFPVGQAISESDSALPEATGSLFAIKFQWPPLSRALRTQTKGIARQLAAKKAREELTVVLFVTIGRHWS